MFAPSYLRTITQEPAKRNQLVQNKSATYGQSDRKIYVFFRLPLERPWILCQILVLIMTQKQNHNWTYYWPPLQMLKARVCETSATGDIETGQLLRA